jgi:hypothetical protein
VKDVLGREGWAAGLSLARVNAWSQNVTAERTFDAEGGSDRVSYASSAAMDGWLASVGFGVKTTERLRLGGSLDGQLTMTEKRQRLGDQFYQTALDRRRPVRPHANRSTGRRVANVRTRCALGRSDVARGGLEIGRDDRHRVILRRRAIR